jgi:hypothetical protein
VRRAALACLLVLGAAIAAAPTSSQSASPVTSPQQAFGANIGDDYFLATYSQLQSYWRTLDRESDRMQMVEIGKTEEGRPQWMAIVSAPENLARLTRYKEIAGRLALAEGLNERQAQALAAEGKAVVWIDGGLHADETLGAQQLIELVYRLTSRSDPETLRILRDVIVLAAHANPDGHELVANWYMRERDPLRRTLDGLPRLYQKYVGHDINRDFYMSTQAETVNINRVLYRDWFPQIVYNHHQAAPDGTVMFAPPFRGPFNYVFDPLVPAGIDMAGSAMHARFAAEGKQGVTMRNGSTYTAWWNGGLRTTAYFHNQIGLLTETIGEPTPIQIPYVAERQTASADLPHPIAPQRWHFRRSVDYSMTANLAVLDMASRYRETLLLNAYRMGKNSIQRGSEDSWTLTDRRRTRDAASRDSRAYVISADQPDFLTAVKFVDALLRNGVAVHRATAPFTANRKPFPRGSYVVKTAQAFRPHVLDMFEPQDHPDDIPSPGARPVPPYDSAGWTLAFQMGVEFERVLDPLEGPFEKVAAVTRPRGQVVRGAGPVAGYLLSHRQNDAFVAVNRLLAAGEDIYWPSDRSRDVMFVAAKASTSAILEKAAADLGVTFTAVETPPAGSALQLRPVRIGLWDRPGGAATSGWTRWLLERFEFPFTVVPTSALDGGALNTRFDVIILPGEAAPVSGVRGSDGAVTRTRTAPQLRRFVEEGGTLLAIGGATAIRDAFDIGVRPAPASVLPDGTNRPLPRESFFIPGSVLRMRVDPTTPLAYGMPQDVDVMFDSSPAFTVAESSGGSEGGSIRRVGWFATPSPLRSGWAWGQQHLLNTAAVVEASVGRGRLVLFGPEILFRGQPHGTFKLLFNGILTARAEPARAR